MPPLKIVQVIPDDRDMLCRYELPEPFFGTAPSALLDGFALLPDEVEVHVISCTRRVMPAPEKLAQNIFFHEFPVSVSYRRKFFVEPVCAVRRCIQEISPDVVHGQGTEEYAALCAGFSGFPNCVTVHGNMRAVAKKRNYKPFPVMHIAALSETIALSRTDAVVCLSEYTRQNVETLAARTVLIPNAVDSSFFNISRSPTDPPRLVCIGGVTSYKNQLALIRALEPLAERHRFELRIIGGGNPESDYVRAVDALCRKYDWCLWTGSLSREQVKEELASASVLVHPSLEDNCPMVVLEAMATGIPVAASAIGGIPDLIKDGENGLLFNPFDPEDMRRQIGRMLDVAVAQKLANAGRKTAGTEHTPESVARRHLEFYRTMVRQP
jgi:glycosyltransferase involved in cell wall biosynthesis